METTYIAFTLLKEPGIPSNRGFFYFSFPPDEICRLTYPVYSIEAGELVLAGLSDFGVSATDEQITRARQQLHESGLPKKMTDDDEWFLRNSDGIVHLMTIG